LKFGALAHDVPYMWSGFHKEPYNVDPRSAPRSSCGAAAFGLRSAPPSTSTDTSKAYLDARWQWECAHNMFYAVGLGIAVHDGETFTRDPEFKQLGRRVLFHPNAEIGYRVAEHQCLLETAL
jgi:lipid A 3-O-deacylase